MMQSTSRGISSNVTCDGKERIASRGGVAWRRRRRGRGCTAVGRWGVRMTEGKWGTAGREWLSLNISHMHRRARRNAAHHPPPRLAFSRVPQRKASKGDEERERETGDRPPPHPFPLGNPSSRSSHYYVFGHRPGACLFAECPPLTLLPSQQQRPRLNPVQ